MGEFDVIYRSRCIPSDGVLRMRQLTRECDLEAGHVTRSSRFCQGITLDHEPLDDLRVSIRYRQLEGSVRLHLNVCSLVSHVVHREIQQPLFTCSSFSFDFGSFQQPKQLSTTWHLYRSLTSSTRQENDRVPTRCCRWPCRSCRSGPIRRDQLRPERASRLETHPMESTTEYSVSTLITTVLKSIFISYLVFW